MQLACFRLQTWERAQ